MSSWTRADCQHRYQRWRRQGQARSLCVMRQEPAWTEHAGAEFMPAPLPLRSRVPVEFGRAREEPDMEDDEDDALVVVALMVVMLALVAAIGLATAAWYALRWAGVL